MILLSCQEKLNVFNMFNHAKEESIRTIVIIGTLQMIVFMVACFQIMEMMLLTVEKILRRANIHMLIDKVDNGINAGRRGDSLIVKIKWQREAFWGTRSRTVRLLSLSSRFGTVATSPGL